MNIEKSNSIKATTVEVYYGGITICYFEDASCHLLHKEKRLVIEKIASYTKVELPFRLVSKLFIDGIEHEVYPTSYDIRPK